MGQIMGQVRPEAADYKAGFHISLVLCLLVFLSSHSILSIEMLVLERISDLHKTFKQTRFKLLKWMVVVFYFSLSELMKKKTLLYSVCYLWIHWLVGLNYNDYKISGNLKK